MTAKIFYATINCLSDLPNIFSARRSIWSLDKTKARMQPATSLPRAFGVTQCGISAALTKRRKPIPTGPKCNDLSRWADGIRWRLAALVDHFDNLRSLDDNVKNGVAGVGRAVCQVPLAAACATQWHLDFIGGSLARNTRFLASRMRYAPWRREYLSPQAFRSTAATSAPPP